MKIKNDKYYTPQYLAEYCVNKTKEVIGENNITEWLEPSAGSGVFLEYLPKNTLAYDLFPENELVIQQDYLTLDLDYKKGRCIIGNPPFGDRNNMSRAFYKKSFRMPTFNDLYYADMGNSQLSPERVIQYNLGFLYDHNSTSLISAARISADVYYNKVKDKIVAYPKGQQFRWTMLNLGLVDIRGIDVTGLLTLNPYRDMYLTVRAQYTFQRAIDITNPSDNYYRDQIPYIPRHSGAAVVNAQWKGWGLNYSWIYVGERYNQQENIRYNYTQPWYTSDVSLSKDFKLGRVNLRGLIEINNLLSQDYDVILNYPMPKRNYKFTLTVEI